MVLWDQEDVFLLTWVSAVELVYCDTIYVSIHQLQRTVCAITIPCPQKYPSYNEADNVVVDLVSFS